jgi:hypothetical protein
MGSMSERIYGWERRDRLRGLHRQLSNSDITGEELREILLAIVEQMFFDDPKGILFKGQTLYERDEDARDRSMAEWKSEKAA